MDAMSDSASLLRRLIPRLRRIARLLISDVEQADDLVETCLHRTIESLARSDADANLLRLSCRHLFDSFLETFEQGPERPTGLRQSNGGALATFLAELSTPVRFTLLLIVLEGMTYEDVGVVTQVPTDEVRRRVAEGRNLLSRMERNGKSSPGEMSGQEADQCSPSGRPLWPAPEA